MGETGCGKTFLLRYVAEVLYADQAEFFSFILYYGVKEEVFIEFMDKIITVAAHFPNKDFWVFFDEFNTSELQSSVCELLFDRIFSISKAHSGNCFYYSFFVPQILYQTEFPICNIYL